jgi:hypothetical protein
MGNNELSWYKKKIDESNQYCLYCGRYIGTESVIPSNKEHLIGREFVPTGSLGQKDSFNFIFRACVEHNSEKANYERHVSNITLYNSAMHIDDIKIKELAYRKAIKDYHPDKKGVKIIDAIEKLDMNYVGENLNLSFSFIAPPQPSKYYFMNLAFMQMQGLFALIHSPRPYNKNKLVLLSSHYFKYIGGWPIEDWGNVVLMYLQGLVENWECYANINTACGFYKSIIKHDPITGVLFWAFEWNMSYRVCGFIGDDEHVKEFIEKLPIDDWKILHQEGKKITRIKRDIPLNKENDKLFFGDID